MKSSTKILLSLGAAGLAGLAIWLLLPRPEKPSLVVPKPAPIIAARPPAPAVAATVAAPPAPIPERPEEVAATARMYAAHASLRTPEVANPDSEGNRQILQTMVGKALQQANSSPTLIGKH